MSAKRKSTTEARGLGRQLRSQRQAQGLTLENLSGETGIDVGQLSRFERGEFKLLSKNLQRLVAHLQDRLRLPPAQSHPALLRRFDAVLARSDRHQAAALALLSALEALE